MYLGNVYWRNHAITDYLGYVGIHESIILKWVLEEHFWIRGLFSSNSGSAWGL